MRDRTGRFVKGSHWRQPKPHWRVEWLAKEYTENQRSAADIAKECGCTENNIFYWLHKHGIARRTVSEVRAEKHWGPTGEANPMFGRVGALNHRYVDGSSPERQRLYVQGYGRAFLSRVLKRDGYRCCRCGAEKTKPKSLHVHHIVAWAGNDSLRFNESNVVTLCRFCHSWVHSNANAGKEYLL